jgi:hypothetical protein
VPIWDVPNLWPGGECWIIGGGSSMPRQFGVPEDTIQKVMTREVGYDAYSPYLAKIHDKHIIGINNAYWLGPWVDVLFFGDCPWYVKHRLALAEFPGLKVSCCPRFANSPKSIEGIKGLRRNPDRRLGITPNKRKLSWNGNSGAAAINLAVHFGAKRIALLGFDMRPGKDGKTHSHSLHGVTKPKTFERHLRGFPQIAEDAKALGVEIINASPDSAVDVFPRVSVEELL